MEIELAFEKKTFFIYIGDDMLGKLYWENSDNRKINFNIQLIGLLIRVHSRNQNSIDAMERIIFNHTI